MPRVAQSVVLGSARSGSCRPDVLAAATGASPERYPSTCPMTTPPFGSTLAAAHRQPGAQPDRTGLHARSGASAWSPEPASASTRPTRWRGAQGRRHQGCQPGQAAAPGADPRALQRRREPARHRAGRCAAGVVRPAAHRHPSAARRTTTWRCSRSCARRFGARARRATRRAAALAQALRAELARDPRRRPCRARACST